MIKVLFVCLANVCRSPMAEGMFKSYVKQKGIEDKFIFESRAIKNWENLKVHEETLNQIKALDVDMKDKTSKPISERDFIEFDYIIGMDKLNTKFLKSFEEGYYQRKVHTYIPKKNVPDPMVTGDFNKTYKLIKKQLDYWFDTWHKKENI